MRQRISPPILLIELVIGAILLLAAAVGALAWRVAKEPLALDRLVPMVEHVLEDHFPGLNPTIGGGVFLAWDAPDQALTLIARDLAVGPAGTTPLAIPEMSLSFDRLRLLRGELSPKAITLLRPRFEVDRGLTGGLRIAALDAKPDDALPAETPPPNAPTAPAGDDWLHRMLRGDGGLANGVAGLDRIGVRGASVLVRDQTSALTAAVEGLDLSFQRVQGVWTLTLAGHAAVRSAVIAINAVATLGAQGWTANGGLTLDQTELVTLRRIAEALSLPIPPPVELLDGKLALSMKGRAEWDGGALSTIRVVDASGEAQIDSLVSSTELLTGLSGRIERADLNLQWAAREQILRGSLKLGPATIAHAEIPAGSIDLRSVDASAIYDRGKDSLRDGRLEIDSALSTISVAASAEGVHGPMKTSIQARTSQIAFEDLRKYWPASVAPNPRRWMLANISRGTVTSASANAVVARVGNDEAIDFISLDGAIEANGMRIQYVPRMPPADQAAGSATFDLKKFEITLLSGVVQRQRLQKGRIDITGLDLKDQDIAFDMTLAGPLASALDILDSPPLGYIKRFGIPLNEVAGDVTTRLLIKFPLLNRLTFDDVKISAESEAVGVRLARIAKGLDVTDGALRVKVDQNALALTGRANVLNQPFAIEWAESFAKAPAQRRSLTVTGDVDGALRKALGLDAEDVVKGPMGAKIVYIGQDARIARLSATLDLRRTTVSVEQLGYAKPVGAAAELRFDTTLLGGVPQTADLIRYTAEGASASGRGRFSANGDLNRLDLDRLRVGETDLSLSYLLSPAGVMISAIGAKLDLRPVLKDKPDKPPEPTKPTRFDLKIASVRVADDIQLSDVQGRLEHDGVRARSAELSARAAGGLIRAALKPGQGGRDLVVDADDAGTLLQAMSLTNSMRGGRLKLTGWYDDRRPESPLQGRMEITDSRVVGAPILSRLLQLASITGIPELLSGNGVAFQTINADFTMTDEAIDLKEMRASGLALGVLLRGKVDRVKDTMDMSGTLVPIYGFNRVLGAIPLLGDLLTGGDGGGLFAFTFAVRGPAANPDLSVNPLSVLAPGLLRRLFEYAPGGETPLQTPSAPQPPRATRD